MPKILRDTDGIYKSYFNEVSRQFEDPTPSLDGLPHIQVKCYTTEASARAAFNGNIEIVDGGFRESTTVTEPISDHELEQELGRLSIFAGMPIPKDVLTNKPTTAQQMHVTEQVNKLHFDLNSQFNTTITEIPQTALEISANAIIKERTHLPFIKKCAKLSATKSKSEKKLLEEYLTGYMDAVDLNEKLKLIEMANEIL